MYIFEYRIIDKVGEEDDIDGFIEGLDSNNISKIKQFLATLVEDLIGSNTIVVEFKS